MDRTPSDIAEIIATAERDLNELKELQIFGGDALIVNEYNAQLSNDASATYQLTLTPSSELGVLPSSLMLKWTNTQIAGQASANYTTFQVYRDDGAFEWRITGGRVNDFDTFVVLQYLGEATVNLVRVS